MTNSLERRSTILHIDCDSASLRSLERALSAEYDLRKALSGAEGIEMAKDIRPDLILLGKVCISDRYAA